MKKTGTLNSEISSVISLMGHGDTLCIADAGLPIPDGVKRIDLAVKQGFPDFLTVLDTVVEDLQIEGVIIADEMAIQNSRLYNEILNRFPEAIRTSVSHEELKLQLVRSKGIVRTGECTPYANIILISGVIF